MGGGGGVAVLPPAHLKSDLQALICQGRVGGLCIPRGADVDADVGRAAQRCGALRLRRAATATPRAGRHRGR